MSKQDHAWKLDSKCGNDPEVQAMIRNGDDPFFERKSKQNKEWIVKYCSDCPVKKLCADEAKAALNGPHIHQLFGYWGGVSKTGRARHHSKVAKDARQMTLLLMEQFQGISDPIASLEADRN